MKSHLFICNQDAFLNINFTLKQCFSTFFVSLKTVDKLLQHFWHGLLLNYVHKKKIRNNTILGITIHKQDDHHDQILKQNNL